MGKKFLLVLVIVLSISTVIVGKIHWDRKIAAHTKVEETKLQLLNEDIGLKEEEQSIEGEELAELPVVETDMIVEEPSINKDELLKLASKLPTEVAAKIEASIHNSNPIHLVIFGSASTSEKEGAWPDMLRQALIEAYGEKIIKVSIKEITGKTSNEVVEEKLYKEAAMLKPDILLIEPFLLEDNGKVDMLDRLNNLSALLAAFKEMQQDITVILQPSNPIFDAHYYIREEYDLERYAARNNIFYINHWEAWPDSKSPNLKDLLTEESLPNEKGNMVWAEYLKYVFINNE